MRTLSNTFQGAAQARETKEVFLSLLTVNIKENDGTTTVNRYVNNNVDITSNLNIYTAASFEISLTSDNSDEAPQTTLRFDSGNSEFIKALREVDARPEVESSIVLASNPDVIEIGPISYEVESFDINASVISAKLIVEPILDEPIPADVYNPSLFPGLWGNVTVS